MREICDIKDASENIHVEKAVVVAVEIINGGTLSWTLGDKRQVPSFARIRVSERANYVSGRETSHGIECLESLGRPLNARNPKKRCRSSQDRVHATRNSRVPRGDSRWLKEDAL